MIAAHELRAKAAGAAAWRKIKKKAGGFPSRRQS
jgi:hypothetical protein